VPHAASKLAIRRKPHHSAVHIATGDDGRSVGKNCQVGRHREAHLGAADGAELFSIGIELDRLMEPDIDHPHAAVRADDGLVGHDDGVRPPFSRD
jgi:hypothetical protein